MFIVTISLTISTTCRYLYIIIAVNNSVIMNTQTISTEDLLEQSMKSSPLYYVAGVVYASQYVPGYRMRYVLGAGNTTTDHNGHVFTNRPVEDDYQYFFRVFSNDSTSEVCRHHLHKLELIKFISFYRMKFILLQKCKVWVYVCAVLL